MHVNESSYKKEVMLETPVQNLQAVEVLRGGILPKRVVATKVSYAVVLCLSNPAF